MTTFTEDDKLQVRQIACKFLHCIYSISNFDLLLGS